ncbi:MAG TPA: response regulator [Bryobacteraceae bacterium]|nr:response regulator [Bryobacteraceae bacterium]
MLVIEDNKADVFLIRDALRTAKIDADVHVVTDGEAAVKFFDRADADPAETCPALVILDLNLPRKRGVDVLRHMRASRRCAEALVLIVTSSDSNQDREAAFELRADGYFRKPAGYDLYMELGDVVRQLLTRNSAASA